MARRKRTTAADNAGPPRREPPRREPRPATVVDLPDDFDGDAFRAKYKLGVEDFHVAQGRLVVHRDGTFDAADCTLDPDRARAGRLRVGALDDLVRCVLALCDNARPQDALAGVTEERARLRELCDRIDQK